MDMTSQHLAIDSSAIGTQSSGVSNQAEVRNRVSKDSRAVRVGSGWVMTKELSTKQRKKLSKKEFALPSQRKYPIPDKAHARNALARVAQFGTLAEQKKVKAAVTRRFPSLGEKSKKK